MAVNFYTDINADAFVKEGGTSTQYLMADGSTTTSAGGSSPWTTDTNGITYTGAVGINTASQSGFKLVVGGKSRFYGETRVSANLDVDLDLDVLGDAFIGGDLSAGGEIQLNGNDILTEGGDILDVNDQSGANESLLQSNGSGGGVQWKTINAASFSAVTSVTTGEPSGSSTIINIVQISKTDYDTADGAGTLVAGTAYLIYAG